MRHIWGRICVISGGAYAHLAWRMSGRLEFAESEFFIGTCGAAGAESILVGSTSSHEIDGACTNVAMW